MPKLEIITFDSQILNRRRKVRLLIPDGNGPFPVVYTADGQLKFSERDAELPYGSWQLDYTLAKFASEGLPHPLVVAVDNSPSRMKEYFPLSGEFESYQRFLREELIPSIRKDYPVLGDPETTAHIGSSMGGLVSFALARNNPDLFGWALCLSPWFEVEDFRYVRESLRLLKEKPSIRVYMDSGIRDWRGLDDGHRGTLLARLELLRLGFKEGEDLLHFVDTWFPSLEEVTRDKSVKEDKQIHVTENQHTEFHFRRRAVKALEYYLRGIKPQL